MSPEEFRILLYDIPSELGNSADYLLLGAKDMEGRLKKRIFNDHQKTNGASMGPYYSASWRSTRRAKGRQTDEIDLEFKGELRNSITTAKDDKDAVVYINNDKKYQIAIWQEEQQASKYGVSSSSIFTPSNDEVEKMTKYLDDIILENIDKLLSKYQ